MMNDDAPVNANEIALLEAYVGCLEVALQKAIRLLDHDQQVEMLRYEQTRIKERDEQQMAHQLGPEGDEFNDITTAHGLVAKCIARVISETPDSVSTAL
ncbi:hypothetical protein K6L44_10135 [Gluconacetobacter entanii]|nr:MULTISPECIES: hypothetical protein [Acetobacteraceae]MBE7620687.1 hypothetical protein [Komagataeibacter sp. FXV2]MCE2579342.1 hypothetical protein [Komagataeibacter sp. FNDCR1]MBY4640339.1 hypothetical protein [Gluconacetobacter entanii]MCW4578985.1 hypothetical protein [Gluconacetobacter entanii]MCW4582385.1 hypothetical protein [Gluconacetobacter entanii]